MNAPLSADYRCGSAGCQSFPPNGFSAPAKRQKTTSQNHPSPRGISAVTGAASTPEAA
jgi:hypothetical protein